MNAPALNPASAPPAGSVRTAATTAAAGTAGGARAGFEALLEALFPQDAVLATSPVAATSGTIGSNAAFAAPSDDVAPEPTEADAEQVAVDANVALLVGVLSAPLQLASAVPEAQPANASDARVVAAPSAPDQFGADLKAGADETAATPDDALPEVVAGAGGLPGVPGRLETPPPALTPASRTGAPLPPSTTALPDPPAPAITAPKPEPATSQVATVPTASAATTAALPATALIARQEPAPTGPVRSARSDRSRAASEIQPAGEPSPLPADDLAARASTAKPVAAVGQSPAAGPERADAATRDIEITGDAPDATLQAEARTAAQTLTPLANGAPAVRGSPETVATLAAHIIKKLEGQSTRFDLELNPAGLGKVDVRIDIGAHGRISAAMVFDNPAAAADLRARASELQRMLEQAGFDMSGGLSFDVAGDRGQQQRHAWQDQNDNGHAFRGQAFRAALDTAGNATDAAVEGALRLRRGINAGLDLRI